MLSFFSFAVILCSFTTCRSFVTTTLEADLFEKTLNQTSEPQLVDVRTPSEYAESHLPDAILIDIKATDFDTLIIQQLDRSRPVFVYCRSGKRSLDAARILEEKKFSIVYNLKGGIIAWEETGKTVIKN
jgi:rhodanese-related sulfurtransferase